MIWKCEHDILQNQQSVLRKDIFHFYLKKLQNKNVLWWQAHKGTEEPTPKCQQITSKGWDCRGEFYFLQKDKYHLLGHAQDPTEGPWEAFLHRRSPCPCKYTWASSFHSVLPQWLCLQQVKGWTPLALPPHLITLVWESQDITHISCLRGAHNLVSRTSYNTGDKDNERSMWLGPGHMG